jgi:two-component system, chemotaxis family, chemotaxis protein CheY
MPNFANMTALVVDDVPHMVMLLTSMLRGLGWGTILSAGTVAPAMKQVRERNPSVVFVDWMMEPVNGIELVKLIRCGFDIPDPSVPIVMITGHGDAARVQDARESGVDAFIVKPVSRRLLAQRLDAVLQPNRKPVIDDREVTVLG